MLFSLIFIMSLFLLLCSSFQNFSACWGFGDALVDTGNNNFFPAFFRSNFRPYGRDFPGKTPTGRFNNGKILIDFICAAIGYKNVTPPYLNTTLANDNELLTGVSFGSSGSGYDPLTATTDNALSLSDQIDLFEEALERIRMLVGEEMANSIVEKSLFAIFAGGVDFVFYFDIRTRALQYNISEYQDFILQQVERNIQRLYNIGGRRFFVSNLPPLGCLPFQITYAGDLFLRQCVRRQNDDSVAYNMKFQLLLSRMEQVLQNSTIVLYDLYTLLFDVSANPAKYGLEVTKRGCCGTGLVETGFTCISPLVRTCPDASKYAFWDALNPTQTLYQVLSSVGIQALHSRFQF